MRLEQAQLARILFATGTNVLASRTWGTNYTNSNALPLMVILDISPNADWVTFTIGGFIVATLSGGAPRAPFTGIVAPGSHWRIDRMAAAAVLNAATEFV